MKNTSPLSSATTRAEIGPLIRLAIPLMTGLAAALLIGVVDTAMIAPLGTIPVAAAGITTAVLIIILSALWGVVTVISVQISQAYGAQDARAVSLALRSGLLLSLLGGVIGMALMIGLFPALTLLGQPSEVTAILFPYWASMAFWVIPFALFFGLKSLFDAVDRPWMAVGLSYIGVLFNIPANYTFIHLLDWGIFGAGLASILSQSAALLAAAIVFLRSPTFMQYRETVAVAWADVWAQFKEALPICLGYAGEGGAYAVVGLMMGWLGAEALAAHQIVNALAGLAYMIPLGMAGAASICVGQAVGANQRNRLRPILKASFLIVTLWQAAACLVFIGAGRWMAETLSTDPAVIDLAVLLFIIVALLQIADGLQGTALGALRGISDMTVPTTITLIAYWPLALPISFVLGFWFELGAVGIWLGYTAGLLVAATALPIRFWKLTQND